MTSLEERFKNMHLLEREERIKLKRELGVIRPNFLERFVPKWWWWKRCRIKTLIVCDGGLNFGFGAFDLSEFLTTFNQLEATSWVDYRVTLAHRGNIINSSNPVVVDHIPNFNFASSVNLNDFDQVWLFGIQPGGSITPVEKSAIESYMDGGGGLFATGDHGSLGKAMCGDIIRVKDMRYWDDTPNSADATNEVSMGGRRRNDTNRPASGDATSIWFDNQSDDIPQTIGVKKFGSGTPHPLLSISASLRPSGVIDVMPDHPHEGECKPETSFTVNGITIPTQIIATSFVSGGSTTSGGAGKALTDPHCFPSISVWNGRLANVGRIVIDSTWHHFVNINLDGTGSGTLGDKPGTESGLNNSDFIAIRQYFMNIATWMTRRKSIICWRRYLVFELLVNSQLIEASLDNPRQDVNEISLADLNSIGALAEEILASRFNPAFARSFLVEIMKEYHEGLGDALDIWKPDIKKKELKKVNNYYHGWLNLDLVLWTSIGAGFIALRDDEKISSDGREETDLERLEDVFAKGIDFGFKHSMRNLESNLESLMAILRTKGD